MTCVCTILSIHADQPELFVFRDDGKTVSSHGKAVIIHGKTSVGNPLQERRSTKM